jgi:hypothetical protein
MNDEPCAKYLEEIDDQYCQRYCARYLDGPRIYTPQYADLIGQIGQKVVESETRALLMDPVWVRRMIDLLEQIYTPEPPAWVVALLTEVQQHVDFECRLATRALLQKWARREEDHGAAQAPDGVG